jgi:hypothetical protein
MINLPSASANVINLQQDPATQPLQGVKDKGAVTARWAAHDDNGDEIIFDLYVRGEGEKNWRLLRAHVTERFYSFDSIRLPDGSYRMRVVASDAPAHPLGDALTGARESDRFIIDTTPPVLTGLEGKIQGGMLHASLVATDATSPIARAEYSFDAGRWQYLEPVGKLSDSLTEHYDFAVPIAALPVRAQPDDEGTSSQAPVADPAEHILTVRVYDRYDNVSAAKTVVR